MATSRAPEVVVPKGEGSAANVLIVDDRDENLLALEAALAPLGQVLLRARSGDEALRMLLKHEIAVIILDVQMPELDGFETAAYIKQLDRTKHIPIIFLTAISKEAQHVFRGYEAGAVDYLFKPFDPVVLRSKVGVFIDLHRKKQELQASEERFRRAFDHAPIGVALVGLDGAFIKVNQALAQITGYSTPDLLTRRIQDVVVPDQGPLHLDSLANEMAEAGARWHAEHCIRTKSGESRFGLVSVSYIPNTPTPGPHFVFQITDITERRALDDFRERFVSHAAHELRTPATVIAGTVALLHQSRDTMGPAEIEQCVTALHRQSERLKTMVANLLDLARLREGRLRAEPEAVDLPTAVVQALDATPPPDGTNVSVEIEAGLRALVDADGLDHILSNLLINAYRYGGQEIRVSAAQSHGEVVLSIADDGPGVGAELVPTLFEAFTRGRASSSLGGSGLGLALVRSLTEASGGRVEYVQPDGGGACFRVHLAGAP